MIQREQGLPRLDRTAFVDVECFNSRRHPRRHICRLDRLGHSQVFKNLIQVTPLNRGGLNQRNRQLKTRCLRKGLLFLGNQDKAHHQYADDNGRRRYPAKFLAISGWNIHLKIEFCKIAKYANPELKSFFKAQSLMVGKSCIGSCKKQDERPAGVLFA